MRTRVQRRLADSVAAAVVALALAGCAVITVDVDVYKGPLANSRDTQEDQVISLAMGAKPLLVQLRDHLEVARSPFVTRGWDGVRGQFALIHSDRVNRLAELRTNTWYRASYIDLTSNPLRSELAIQVNEILGLYENRTDSRLATLFREAQIALANYAKAEAVFNPSTLRADLEFWSSLTNKFRPGVATNTVEAWLHLLVPQREAVESRTEFWRDESGIFLAELNKTGPLTNEVVLYASLLGADGS